jgi:hypothetical protein
LPTYVDVEEKNGCPVHVHNARLRCVRLNQRDLAQIEKHGIILGGEWMFGNYVSPFEGGISCNSICRKSLGKFIIGNQYVYDGTPFIVGIINNDEKREIIAILTRSISRNDAVLEFDLYR